MSSQKYKFQSHSKKFEKSSEDELYSINKIIGFNSKNNFSITQNDNNGLIAWICGTYAIFYDISTNNQVLILKNINNKIISCIKFSNNGKYFITGEGNCKNGEICLYEIINKGEKYNYKLILTYINHIKGIEKLFFFKEDKFILSIGNKEDGLINIMDIDNKIIIYTYKFNNDIPGVDICGDYAVICGYNFVRIYKFNYVELTKNKNPTDFLIKKSVDLNKLKEKNFIYALIYESGTEKQQKIFLLTEDGYLVEMIPNQLTLNRWVNLKIKKCYNLTIWENKIGIGCNDGIYRIFNLDNLTYIQTLPNPPPIINETLNKNYLYSDIICNLYNKFHNKLITVDRNKVFMVWEVQNNNEIKIKGYHRFENNMIKTIDVAIDETEGIIKIITSNEENSIIYWNFKINEPFPNFNIYNWKNHDNNEKNIDITTIKFSVDQNYSFIANSMGNLIILSLENNINKISEIHVHKDRINTIDIISINNNNNEIRQTFLATGSSDKSINIYKRTKNIEGVKSIKYLNIIKQKMTSEVINVKLYQDSNYIIKIIVVELNLTITFFQLNKDVLNKLQTYQESELKTYYISYIPSIQKILSGHNGKILIWKTNSTNVYKNFEVSKGNKILDNLIISVNKEGIIFATFNDDKIIRIRALYNGKILGKIEIGEDIIYLDFILNDNYLLAVSTEGTIYFYKINKNFIYELKNENVLINSIEEKNIINNKFKFLQKLIENDVSSSKNEKMKKLVDKLSTNETPNFDDINQLDEFIFESKNRLSIKHEDITELKEDINTNKNLQINQKNSGIIKDGINKINKSDIKKNYKKVKNKISIQDSHMNNKIDIRNCNFENNNLNKIKSARKVKSPDYIKIKNISPKKFNFEKKINQTESKIYSYNPNEIIKLSIKSKLKYNKFDTPKHINNNKYKKILKRYNTNKLKFSKNITFSIVKQNKQINKHYIISNQINLNNQGYNAKDILIKQMKDININNINKKNDLIILENKLQLLKEKIRLKLNLPIINAEKEKLLDTFGSLIIDKISNSSKYK